MKNFDIENIERKNIYKTPENFLDQVQESVLQKISQENTIPQTTKIFKLNWVYVVAASLTLLFGLVTFFNYEENNEQQISEQKIDTVYASNNSPQENLINNEIIETETQVENKGSIKTNHTINPTIKTTQVSNTKSGNNIRYANQQNKLVTKKTENKTQPVSSEAQLDQVIKEMSNTEIADIGIAAEQDVYLDLYN